MAKVLVVVHKTKSNLARGILMLVATTQQPLKKYSMAEYTRTCTKLCKT